MIIFVWDQVSGDDFILLCMPLLFLLEKVLDPLDCSLHNIYWNSTHC